MGKKNLGKWGGGMERAAQIRQSFGQRVRRLREAKGWELDDLGQRLGKSRATMSRIETGKQNLKIADIATIATELNVPIAILFGGTVTEVPREAILRHCYQLLAFASSMRQTVLDLTMVADGEIPPTQDHSAPSHGPGADMPSDSSYSGHEDDTDDVYGSYALVGVE
jgi:XRE family transcriptional regulator, regulator of sulfur utilization